VVLSAFLLWAHYAWAIYVLLAVAISYTVLLAYGSYAITWNFYLNSLHQSLTKKKTISLSFDDGPHEHTLSILALLKKYNVKATFFIIGKQVQSNSQVLKQIIEDGHEIGNHTYEHSYVSSFYSEARLQNELLKCNQVVYEETGLKMKLFRPTFGVTTPTIARVIQRLGFSSIGWSFRSYDTTAKSVDRIVEAMNKNIQGGDIILLHDNRAKAVDILERILPQLQIKFQLVKVSDLLDIKAYDE
jgi:peptidoglycan/xylan/chitin deacetylase (PgdA/CDA1 family)